MEKENIMAKANVNGIDIEYETFGASSSPTLLLIMGIGGQLIQWQEEFCRQIADHGYHVIRYDNRDSGLSTKFSETGMPEITEKIGALFMGREVVIPYYMEDMADDAAGLLDALNIDKAHICGMSMGGYIAQTLVLRNPSRALSLTSIYSHPGSNGAFLPSQEVMAAFMTPAPEEKEKYIQYMLKFLKMTYGSGLPFDEEFHREVVGRSFDRSFCPEGTARQFLAVLSQKDRAAALGRLTVPSLIIHGDEDPLVPVAGGKATADAIPGAEFKIIRGMGHVLPNLNAYWSDIMSAMIDHMGKVKI